MITVAICVITFRRPAGLAALLDGLAALREPPDTRIRVVVIDNDPAGEARAAVASSAVATRWPVHAGVEPRRGIPQARNAAVAAARDADFVAFVDDDEVPHPDWLAELVAVQRRTGADVVTGPVLPRFACDPPPWVVCGRFFERPRFSDGAPVHYAYTSNVLFSTRLLPADQPAFDERFALTGGEDTHFFLRARLSGARIVWADRAVVTETVPASRARLSWLARRSYRKGTTLSICLRDLQDSPWRRIRRVGHGGWCVATGTAMVLASPAGGRELAARGILRVAYGLGLVAGLAGRSLPEYGRIHGA